jgi:hypothetical protein
LAVVGPAHLDAGNLGQGIGTIGGLERTGEQILFLNRLRAELGVDAGRAQEEKPVDACTVTGVNDVGLNDQVFADEVRRIEIVGQDAAYLGRSQKNVTGVLALEEVEYSARVGEIQFCV